MDLGRNRTAPGMEGPKPGQEGYQRTTKPGSLVQGLDELIALKRSAPKPVETVKVAAKAQGGLRNVDLGTIMIETGINPAFMARNPKVASSIAQAVRQGLPIQDAKLLAKVAEANPVMASKFALDQKALRLRQPLGEQVRAVYQTIIAAGPTLSQRQNLDAYMATLTAQSSGLFRFLRTPKAAPAAALLGDPRTLAALQKDPQAYAVVARTLNEGGISQAQALFLLKNIGTSRSMARMLRANPRPAFVRMMASDGFLSVVKNMSPDQRMSLANNPKRFQAVLVACDRLGYNGAKGPAPGGLRTFDLSKPENVAALLRNPFAFRAVADRAEGMRATGHRWFLIEANTATLTRAIALEPELADNLALKRNAGALGQIMRLPKARMEANFGAIIALRDPSARPAEPERLSDRSWLVGSAWDQTLEDRAKLAYAMTRSPAIAATLQNERAGRILGALSPDVEARLMKTNPYAIAGALRAINGSPLTEAEAVKLLEMASENARVAQTIASGKPMVVKRIAENLGVSRNMWKRN